MTDPRARPLRFLAASVVAATAAIALAGCAGGYRGAHHGAGARDAAMATLSPTQGNAAKGIVMFHADGDGVFVHARVSGL
jgi:hypothetical protein